MMKRSLVFPYLILCFCFIPNLVDGQKIKIETKAGQSFDVVCPAKRNSKLKLFRDVHQKENSTEIWFVSGIRSWWDSEINRRQTEFQCCKFPNDFLMLSCASVSQIYDSKKNFDINSIPSIGANNLETIDIIRNVAIFDSLESLTIRFNVCKIASSTFDWCSDGEDDSCYKCQRLQSVRAIRSSPTSEWQASAQNDQPLHTQKRPLFGGHAKEPLPSFNRDGTPAQTNRGIFANPALWSQAGGSHGGHGHGHG